MTLLLLFAKKAFVEYETTAFIILEESGNLGYFDLVSALQYLTIPAVYLWKFTVISFVLWIGSFLFGYKLTYARIFGLVIVAETVFLIPEALKIAWFMFVETDANYYTIRAFYPLSIMNFVDYREVGDQYHYPLKALNVFEVAYWFFLVQLIHYAARKRIKIAFAIVFSSYVLFFLIWLWFYSAVNN